MRGTLPAALVTVFLVGCGDDDGGQPTPAEAAELCDDFCTACCDEGDDCRASCQSSSDYRCYSGAALEVYVDCVVDTECNLDDLVDCADRIPLSAAHEAWGENCRDRLADCGRSPDEISDDCNLDDIRFYNSDWAQDARGCFAEDCAAIDACLEASRDSC